MSTINVYVRGFIIPHTSNIVKNMYAVALTLVLNRVLTSTSKNFVENLKNCLNRIAIAITISSNMYFIFLVIILDVKFLKNDTNLKFRTIIIV